MASIFISHSSNDDALASDVEAWLETNGFTDFFIDHSSIRTGENWADALRASAGACRVVVCLVTENWLASAECASEFRAAWYMGKRIVPLFLLADDAARTVDSAALLTRVRAETQGIDLSPFYTDTGALDFSRDEALSDLLRRGLRAAGALTAVGLDPAVFEIDCKSRPSPFPGLNSFGDEDADAALFFGRSREIAETLEELRAMRALSDRRPLVILGASGAGKSSLLKAGIIPRLRREAPTWVAMRSFRPGVDPLLNFAEAITRTLADFNITEAYGALRGVLFEAWRSAPRDDQGELSDLGRNAILAALEAQGQRLRVAAARPDATILISVDQAEELVRAEGESGEMLGAYLRAAINAGDMFRLAFTIRTDSFHELQSNRRFQGLESRGYDLRALPVFRLKDVVETPARRYGVEIDLALVDTLIEEVPKEDALPLLAFAMQRMWGQFAAAGAIRVEDYRSMGGIAGLIEDAAERALCGLGVDSRDLLPPGGARRSQVALGARTFVPALADVSETGVVIRRTSAWSEFDEEQRTLLIRFDGWRLIVRKGKENGGTVEVAHEAIFRAWSRMREWLQPEIERLGHLKQLQMRAWRWSERGRRDRDLVLARYELAEMIKLQRDKRYCGYLAKGSVAREFLAAARNRVDTNIARIVYLVWAALGWILMTSIGSALTSRGVTLSPGMSNEPFMGAVGVILPLMTFFAFRSAILAWQSRIYLGFALHITALCGFAVVFSASYWFGSWQETDNPLFASAYGALLLGCLSSAVLHCWRWLVVALRNWRSKPIPLEASA